MAMIHIGNDKYTNIVTERDYVDIMRDKISWEFAREIEEWFEEADREIEYYREDRDNEVNNNKAYVDALEDVRMSISELKRTIYSKYQKDQINDGVESAIEEITDILDNVF
jgi:hypothetical protein